MSPPTQRGGRTRGEKRLRPGSHGHADAENRRPRSKARLPGQGSCRSSPSPPMPSPTTASCVAAGMVTYRQAGGPRCPVPRLVQVAGAPGSRVMGRGRGSGGGRRRRLRRRAASPFAAVEIGAIAHVGGQLGGGTGRWEENLPVAVAAAGPGDVELLPQTWRRGWSGKQARPPLRRGQGFEDFRLPAVPTLMFFAVGEYPDGRRLCAGVAGRDRPLGAESSRA